MKGRQPGTGRVPATLAATLMLLAAAPAAATEPSHAAPAIEYTRGALATADFGAARLSGTENRIAVRGAVRPAGDGSFRWALDYAYQRYEYSGLPTRNRDLHRLEVPLTWRGQAPTAWETELRPVVATSSNVFKELWSRGSGDDLMLHGRLLRERAAVGARWGWRAGVAYDDAFGAEQAYPVFALLREHHGMRMELGWPVTRAMLEVGPGFAAGGEVAPAGASWHVVSDERDGASFDYEVRAWRAGATLRWQSSGGVFLTTRAGLEFERRHRLEDDTGAIVNRAVEEAGFFELAAGYRW
jgi:hypothetical protein